MPTKEGRQYRSIQDVLARVAETDAEKQSYIVEGYACRFNQPYSLFDGVDDSDQVYEDFTRDAFRETDMLDVRFLVNHQGTPVARTRNGTLTLEIRQEGLFVRADLSGSAAGRELYEIIGSGLICEMSWAFRPASYEWDEEKRTLTHTGIPKVYDVSAVSFPANGDTSIEARSGDGEITRSFVDGAISEAHGEMEQRKQIIERIERQAILKKLEDLA